VLGRDRDRAAGYVHMGMANATLRGLDLDATQTSAERASEIAKELGDEVLDANASLLRGLAMFERGSVTEGGRAIEAANAAAESTGSPFLVLLTCWNRGYLHLALDDPVAADAWYTREMGSSRFEDAPRASSVLAVNHHRCLFAMGRLTELEPHWRGGWALAIADRLGTDPTVARTEINTMLAEHRSGGDRWTLLWHLHLSAAALRMLELRDDARRALDEAAAIAMPAGSVVQQVAIHCEYAMLDPASGRSHVDAAREIVAREEGFGRLSARVDAAEAVVAAASGDVDSAEGLFASAIEGFAGGRVWLEADTQTQWGHARAAAGDVGGARERWEAAAEIYRGIDAASHWIDRLPL
jgi:hypothetical protein